MYFLWILIIAVAVVLGLFVRSAVKFRYLTLDLAEERDHLISLVNALTTGIIEYDKDLKILLMNAKAEEISGVSFEKIQSVDIRTTTDRQFFKLRKIILFDDKRSRELVLESLGGEKIYLDISTIPSSRRGPATSVKVLRDTSRDISLSHIKSEFISVAAHQLRTPLAAIKWTLKVMLEGEIGAFEPGQKDYLNKAYASVERMNHLISDLLDVTRIEEGRFGYEFKEADFGEVLNEVLKSFEVTSRKKLIKLNLKEPRDRSLRFTFDPNRVKIALSNLLDNAFNYTRPAGVIEVEYKRQGAFLEVSVQDSGIGIPEDEKSRVFSKFFRGGDAVRMQTEGTGLGLFISRNIVRRHGGDIRFSSVAGQGSRFTFTLPLKKEYIPKSEGRVFENFLEAI